MNIRTIATAITAGIIAAAIATAGPAAARPEHHHYDCFPSPYGGWTTECPWVQPPVHTGPVATSISTSGGKGGHVAPTIGGVSATGGLNTSVNGIPSN